MIDDQIGKLKATVKVKEVKIAQQAEQINKLREAIKEKAVKIAPDYPNIATCEPWEHLWAIESSYEGTSLANDDCHEFIDMLRQRLGMTKEEAVDLWISHRNQKEEAQRKEQSFETFLKKEWFVAQQPPLPAIGTKAVHKDDYEKMQGPVWEVTRHPANAVLPPMSKITPEKWVELTPAKHKLNTTPTSPKIVSPQNFQDNYKVL